MLFLIGQAPAHLCARDMRIGCGCGGCLRGGG
jgi:hypothetical protein